MHKTSKETNNFSFFFNLLPYQKNSISAILNKRIRKRSKKKKSISVMYTSNWDRFHIKNTKLNIYIDSIFFIKINLTRKKFIKYFFLYKFLKPLKKKIKNKIIFNNRLLTNFCITNSRLKKKLKLKTLWINMIKHFIISFLNSKINQQLGISFIRYPIREPKFKSFYFTIVRKVKYMPMLPKLRLKYKNIIRAIYAGLFFKDLEVIKNWIIKNMNRLPFKFHRHFLYFMKVLMIKIMFPYFDFFKVIGFNFTTHGKIAVGGNSKTKTYIIKTGSFCRTKKELKLLNVKASVKTLPGVLGLDLFLTY